MLSAEGLFDYVSVTIGSSSSYRGSEFIVPPAPTVRNVVEGFARRRAGGQLGAGDRHRPDPRPGRCRPADRRAAYCDAVGMTRAMITDPSLAVQGPATVARSRPASAATRAASATTTPGVPIACTINPWTGFERTPARAPNGSEARRRRGRVGAGPAGVCRGGSAVARGDRVVLFERGDGPGGQMRLALQAPGQARDRRRPDRGARAAGWRACDVRYAHGRRRRARCWHSIPTG